MNSNCSKLLYLRNLQEQVKKVVCYQKLFWPFTVWINCSSDLKKVFSISFGELVLHDEWYVMKFSQLHVYCNYYAELWEYHSTNQNCCWKFGQLIKLMVLKLKPVHSWLSSIFFMVKTFLFFKIESWNFEHLLEKMFRETSQKFNSIGQPIENMEIKIVYKELNKLKLYKVSQNYFSNRCWILLLKFTFSKKATKICKIFTVDLTLTT